MTQYTKTVIIKRWLPLLEEYEKVKNKTSNHFKKVKDLISAYHVTKRDLYKYYDRWITSGKNIESFLPQKRGPRYTIHVAL